MAWRSAGSAARSFVSATARAPSLRSPPATLPRLRPSQSSLPRRRFASFPNPRNLGELGCTQSLLPLHNVVASARLTSHLNVNGMEKMGDGSGFSVAVKRGATALYLNAEVCASIILKKMRLLKGVSQEELIGRVVLRSIRNQET